MSRLRVQQKSLDVIRDLRPLVQGIRRRSTDLARQIERAATSVALNIAEANQRDGQDNAMRFRIAGGSAEEVRCALQVAVAWGYLDEGRVAPVLDGLDGIVGTLWVLGRGRQPKAP